MKLHTLGTCAGTEPMPTRQHASCVFEINGHQYWFDAGAGCSRTAALGGLPLTGVDTIFISHRHRDHTGGLPPLLWAATEIEVIIGIVTGCSRSNTHLLLINIDWLKHHSCIHKRIGGNVEM